MRPICRGQLRKEMQPGEVFKLYYMPCIWVNIPYIPEPSRGMKDWPEARQKRAQKRALLLLLAHLVFADSHFLTVKGLQRSLGLPRLHLELEKLPLGVQ